MTEMGFIIQAIIWLTLGGLIGHYSFPRTVERCHVFDSPEALNEALRDLERQAEGR